MLLCAALAPAQAVAGREPQSRSVKGQVTDSANRPVPSAVVYLKNTKTLAVKTFITEADGNYRFHALLTNQDYEVYAESKGQRSDNKTISQFDTRQEVTVNLKIKR
jgi:protocatechuate 3,4-dioxygenase beta subunit